jgi:hypothetical protein
MSLIPMGGHTVAPNPSLVDHYPDVYLSTGLVAENHARESGISGRAGCSRFGATSVQSPRSMPDDSLTDRTRHGATAGPDAGWRWRDAEPKVT